MRIDGYWMEAVAYGDGFYQELTIPAFPPGTNVWASISLSLADTEFLDKVPDPTFSIVAHVFSWTVYEPDGTQVPEIATGFQNSVGIENCGTITFILGVQRALAMAQINVFSF